MFAPLAPFVPELEDLKSEAKLGANDLLKKFDRDQLMDKSKRELIVGPLIGAPPSHEVAVTDDTFKLDDSWGHKFGLVQKISQPGNSHTKRHVAPKQGRRSHSLSQHNVS